MTNMTVGVITKMREILEGHPEIHTIPGNKARVYAIEDDVIGIKLESVELLVKEGIVRVDFKEMYLIKHGGQGVSICRHENWKEFIGI